jgi:hypothetical protein
LPPEARFFVVESRKEKEVLASSRWGERPPREVVRVKDYRNKTVILYAHDPA